MNKKRSPSRFAVIIFLALLIPNPGSPQESPLVKGDLVGHIYEKDGITPVSRAVLQIKRLPSGDILTSSISDEQGMFRVRNMEKGVYLLGVKTSLGNFNCQKLLGILISAHMTAQLEIRLSSETIDGLAGFFVHLLPDPVGQVSIMAGNEFIFDGIAKIDDEPREAGPFRIRSPE